MASHSRRGKKRYRSLVRAYYPQICNWPGCKITDPLDLDHVKEDGAKARGRKARPSGSSVDDRYWKAIWDDITAGKAERYQMLCPTHNRLKHSIYRTIQQWKQLKL